MYDLGPRCFFCKHYRKDDPGACDAFPDGIVGPILAKKNDHSAPYEGDHGIQFELDPDLTPDDIELYKSSFEREKS